jgi:hypothetical protein
MSGGKQFFKEHLLFITFILVTSVLLMSSCKKNASDGSDSGGGNTTNITPITSNSSTDTGIGYFATTQCEYNQTSSQFTNSGWTLAFEDNFDGDLSKWDVWTGGGNSNELQYYQQPNLQVANGVLQVLAKKENVTGVANPSDKTMKSFKFTSGRIESKTYFSANAATPKVRISARIKLAAGFGMIPVFLTYGTPWPINGHINMLIANGQAPKRYITNYFYGNTVNVNAVANAYGYITADADLSTCFHVYEMEWSRDALTFYLDGKQVEKKTSGGYIPSLFGLNEKLALYLSVQSDFIYRTKIEPGTMSVDWVRVFTSK